MNQRLITIQLEHLGFTVDAVDDGEAAVQACNETEFKVVLLDMQMPKLDGLCAARNIRESSQYNRSTPIVILTADLHLKHRAAEDFAGVVTDVLVKPVSEDALSMAIQQCLTEGHR